MQAGSIRRASSCHYPLLHLFEAKNEENPSRSSFLSAHNGLFLPCPCAAQQQMCQATFRRCAQELYNGCCSLSSFIQLQCPSCTLTPNIPAYSCQSVRPDMSHQTLCEQYFHGYQEALFHHWCRPCRTYGSQGAAQTGMHQCHHCRTGSPGWWHLQNRTLQWKLH